MKQQIGWGLEGSPFVLHMTHKLLRCVDITQDDVLLFLYS
jgi:hypothetical protein